MPTATSQVVAINCLNLDESSTVPEPKSRFDGSPLILRAACVVTSTGLVTMMKVALGERSTSGGITLRMSATVDPARSIRVCPGFCFAPAVTTTTSAPRVMSTSSEPSITASGRNCPPCARSSASARTLGPLTSCRTTCLATPRMRAA